MIQKFKYTNRDKTTKPNVLGCEATVKQIGNINKTSNEKLQDFKYHCIKVYSLLPEILLTHIPLTT